MNARAISPGLLMTLKGILFAVATTPLGLLISKALHDELGANPIEKISHETGFWTLFMLLISLSITPLRQSFGFFWLMRLRRMLGLLAFFYACLHALTYFVLDQYFDWNAIVEDIVKRPYITVGFFAFIALIPLAITSSDAMIRKLGGQNWRRLHWLVYPIAIAGVLHFIWLVKKDLSRPLIFATWLGLLLGFRLVTFWRKQRRDR